MKDTSCAHPNKVDRKLHADSLIQAIHKTAQQHQPIGKSTPTIVGSQGVTAV
jgi:hypothetical protein